MPPIVALLACIALCYYVTAKEIKQVKSVSAAVWIPALWFLRCSSRSLSYWFETGHTLVDSSEGSVSDRLLFLGLMAAAFVVVARRRINWGAFIRRDLLLVAFFAYMAASVLWAQYPDLAIKRYSRAVGDMLMVMVMLSEERPLLAIAAVLRRTVMILIPFSVVTAKYYGSIGRMHEHNDANDSWIGVTTHKNELGQLCAVAAVYLVWHLYLVRKGRLAQAAVPWMSRNMILAYLALTAYLLNGGGSLRSTTAILITMAGVGLFATMEVFRKNLHRLWWSAAAGVLFYVAADLVTEFATGQSLYATILIAIGKDPTLTDRTDLWADLVTMGKAHSLLGSGYMSFWSYENQMYLIENGWTWGPKQGHNGYLETFLHLGIIGVAFLGFVILVGFVRILRMCDVNFELGRIRLLLLSLAVVGNVSESGFGRPTNLLWNVFLLAAVEGVPLLNKRQSQTTRIEQPMPVRQPARAHT